MISRRGLALVAARRQLFLCTSSSSLPIGSATTSLARCRNDRTVIPRFGASSRAWESTATLDPTSGASLSTEPDGDTSGHIAVSTNESILFFDNIFPLKVSSVLFRPWKTDQDVADLLTRFESSSLGILDPIRLVKTAIPDDLPIKVTEILPRLKDGGAFVKFKYDASIDPAEIEAKLAKRLKEKPVKPLFSIWRGVTARLVQGNPWLEDLARYPSSLLKVEFVPPKPGTTPEELPEEMLYTLFRKYGKIADIVPQPTDSKIVPRYAHVSFPLIRDSIMARNCMHGFVVGEALGGGQTGTKLRLSFEKRVKANSIWNWLTSHPRVVLPVLAALLAGLSVVIFDPIREFFVKLHVQRSLDIKDSKIYKWFKKQTGNFSLGNSKKNGDGLGTVWQHRRDDIAQVQGWLEETSDTFIVVTGPKGSGKVEMIMNQSLEGRKNVLKLDCRPIVEARGEAATIRRLAAAVGYRPIFSWANGISSMVDLAVQSTTGVKAGFSETLESQLTKILHTTTSALKKAALSERHKRDSDANLADDAYLEAHPERRPVVVVDNFLHKNEENSLVYEKIAEWAASAVQNNVAHVIFLTTDSAYSKPLAKALPDRIFRTVSLGDLAPDVAKKFVLSRLRDQIADEEIRTEEDNAEKKALRRPDLAELDECINTLGGRLTDLEFLARRLRTGQTPKEAVHEIVNETATDVVRMFLLGKSSDTESKKWSPQQAWHLIKSLAQNPTLRYNQIVLSPTFAASTIDAETALDSLTSSELIAVKTHQGRPQTITAGKPLHQAAFAVLLHDQVLKAKMDLDILTEVSKAEAKSIDKVETELSLLGSLPRQTGETAGRITFLLAKLEASQAKISQWDQEMGRLKKILNEEY
ncbi:RNA12 protein-domain-containing protein [Thelonectria olida]|uniref:Mitochondrial escape protein 2 n=1 Tax=Thelonectria olida TaxID=1576542 RepID=A0A9P8WLT5_9HYPO|nr:RNA12 protein-domain-containing protein [Thelonectria olida]